MARKKKNEATVVASPRSRKGQAEENKIKEQLRGAKSKIKILTDEGTNAFSDFAKYLEKEIRKELEPEIEKLMKLQFSLTKKKIN